MKSLTKFLVLATGLILGTSPGAIAGNLPDTANAWMAGQDGLSIQSQRDSRSATLRAQWLQQGHTLQQLSRIAAPAITGGSVKASTITVGEAGEFPSMTISYTTDTVGLSFIAVEFASPNGKIVYSGSFSTYYYTQSGKVKFAIAKPLSLFSMPGTWSLAGATIYDNAGNTTSYNADQLKALFKKRSFTVVNSGPVIKSPPKILSGQLLNTTVSLSDPLPLLKATIKANDDQGPGIYQAFLIISPPDGSYRFYSFLPNAMPVSHGKIKANNVFSAYSPTGTWSITGYGVCDYDGNCSGSNTDADVIALLGTDTFTVTP